MYTFECCCHTFFWFDSMLFRDVIIAIRMFWHWIWKRPENPLRPISSGIIKGKKRHFCDFVIWYFMIQWRIKIWLWFNEFMIWFENVLIFGSFECVWTSFFFHAIQFYKRKLLYSVSNHFSNKEAKENEHVFKTFIFQNSKVSSKMAFPKLSFLRIFRSCQF